MNTSSASFAFAALHGALVIRRRALEICRKKSHSHVMMMMMLCRDFGFGNITHVFVCLFRCSVVVLQSSIIINIVSLQHIQTTLRPLGASRIEAHRSATTTTVYGFYVKPASFMIWFMTCAGSVTIVKHMRISIAGH